MVLPVHQWHFFETLLDAGRRDAYLSRRARRCALGCSLFPVRHREAPEGPVFTPCLSGTVEGQNKPMHSVRGELLTRIGSALLLPPPESLLVSYL